MAVTLTGQNPYALSTNLQIQFASSSANMQSTSLSSGIRQDMSVVENGISNKLLYQKGTLFVVNKNMSYQKSQLNVMQNSLNRMKETLAKMSEVVISSYNKSEGQRKDLTSALETYVELFNKQLKDAEFGDKKLLGGEHFNTDMRVGTNSNDTYNMKLNAINSMYGGKSAATLIKHADAAASLNAAVEAIVLGATGQAHDANPLNTAITTVAKRVANHVGTNINATRTAMITAFEAVRNDNDPATGNLGNAHKASMETILKAGPEMIALTINTAIAAKAQGGAGNAVDAVRTTAASDNATQFKLDTDTNAKATEAVIKGMVDLIDGKLIEVNAYIDSVNSISDSQQSKIEVTTETLDAYSKADIVKTAQEFQDFLTKLKLALQVLASGQRLSDEAIDSVNNSLIGDITSDA